MSLLQFIAKKVRNTFFDTTKKFQVDYERFDKAQIAIKRSKTKKKKQTFERKDKSFGKDRVSDIEKGNLYKN